MTNDKHSNGCADKHSPESARNLGEARAHVYSNVKFFFDRGDGLAYARALGFVQAMQTIGERQMLRAFLLALTLGVAVGATLVRLVDYCFR